jgi:hypothetical protein
MLFVALATSVFTLCTKDDDALIVTVEVTNTGVEFDLWILETSFLSLNA